MPLEGLRFVPDEDLLTADEISLVARAAVSCGFRKFRITGGEPTLRRDLIEVVAGIRAEGPDAEIGMTTNGILLPKMARDLKDAGLDRVNIHIDTLDEVRIRQVMRFADVQKIMAGIEAAEDAGLTPIKLNSVVVRGDNDTDVVEMARQTLTRPWGVRFIELMPMGDGDESKLALSKVVSSEETMEMITDSIGPLIPLPATHPSDESRNYQFSDGIGTVGFISPVSDPFCSACNRVRLSAEGKLLLCLLRDDEADLRAVIRGGGGVEAVSHALRQSILLKPVGHALDEGIHASRRMHEIGG